MTASDKNNVLQELLQSKYYYDMVYLKQKIIMEYTAHPTVKIYQIAQNTTFT